MSLAEAAPRPTTSSDLPDTAARLLAEIRGRRTRVHAITNAAAQALTANLLLAAGAVPSAIATMRAQGKPWVLDPVFVDASPPRLEMARLCLAGKPSVLRCNRSEFVALSSGEPTVEAVSAYAGALPVVVALTGAIDWVSDGQRFVEIANGHPLMTRVTAMGCATSALV